MLYFTYQGNDHDCGFASLKMLLATLNKNKSYLYLDKEVKREEYSFLDLIEIGKEHGVLLKPYKYRIEEVNDIKTPFLALINENHLVLVKSSKRGSYEIYDPAKGIYKMKYQEFDRIWTGKTLEVNEYNEVPYKKKRTMIMPLKFTIVSLAISLVSLFSILVGFFFVKDDSYFFIPVIFLAVFAIAELVDNWYLIKEINIFDKKYIPIFFAIKKKDVKAQYKDYLKFKTDYFGFGRKFYGACIMSVVIIVVLIINDPINSIACLSLILLILLERMLFKKKDDELQKELDKNEELLIDFNNKSLVDDLLLINQNANSFALNVSMRKCIDTFIIVILSFTMMIISGNISVNFIIFHFGAFYIFFNNIDAIVTMGEKKKEYDIAKTRFIDTCNL